MARVLISDVAVTLPPPAPPSPKIAISEVSVAVNSPSSGPRILISQVSVKIGQSAQAVGIWTVDHDSQSWVPIKSVWMVDETLSPPQWVQI